MKGYFYLYNGELVAYFTVSCKDNTYTLDYFEVIKSMRGKGIGTFLLNKVKSLYAEFLIEAVPGSYRFYLSRGAKPVFPIVGVLFSLCRKELSRQYLRMYLVAIATVALRTISYTVKKNGNSTTNTNYRYL